MRGSACDTLGIEESAPYICIVPTDNPASPDPSKGGELLKVFPNPTSGTTRLVWNEPLKEAAIIEITNNIGQVVQMINIGVGFTYQEIDIKNQPNGIYFVSLRGKTFSNIIKLVKNE